MAASENKKKYDMEYKRKNTKQKILILNKNTESDLIEWIEDHKPFNTYIKQLIKEDMKKSK